MREAGRVARFKGHVIEPGRSEGLSPDHPAVVEGRTLFPSMVVNTFDSPRFLISGANNSKIGRKVEKGAWAGMPVFVLTLEERRTCPRSCGQWGTCYGNSTPFARRHNAFDPDFMPALKAEVITLVRELCARRPERKNHVAAPGIVLRLHVLGDFFSVAYVRVWRSLLAALPELRLYGYTHHHLDSTDAESRAIAEEILLLQSDDPERAVFRTSHSEPGAGRTIVVPEPIYGDPDIITCPAQSQATAACSTCALCWSRSAWDKTIAFIEHGMPKRPPPKASGNRRPGGRGRHVERNERGFTPAQDDLYQALRRLRDDRGVVDGINCMDLCREAGVSRGDWHKLSKPVLGSAYVQVLRKAKGRGATNAYRVFDEAQDAWPPAPPLALPARKPGLKVSGQDERQASMRAVPRVQRAPDAPLVARAPEPAKRAAYNPKAKYHPRTGALLNPYVIGTAADYEIGTAEERIAAVPETELERIARMYGATVKKAAAE